ncbi:AAA family ATPase [Spirosoma linguale]|uniref:ATP-dependent endonuclease (OLD family protein) n=1 Tax=Spirosoma linguale (strain ATCC 33905 / DSM 74 / LMG 10896 / Claus 1) TaxID=504472 RepID=D2QPA8_SPILD|nr:putative ATP-dependent endonuclease (OLD family protein) [Spirosoma linguale DSM 74]
MITRLTIENFKAFQYAELNLTELNLLTGVNGVGKSSVLQALLLLRQSRRMDGLSLRGELIDIGVGSDALSINADTEFISFEISSSGGGHWSYKYSYEPSSDFLPYWEQDWKGDVDFTSLLNDGHFQYLNAERKSPTVVYPASEYQVRQLRSVGKYGEYAVHFLAQYQREPIVLKSAQIAESNTLLDQVDAWFQRISAGTRLTTTYRSDLNVATLTYRFEAGENVTPDFTPVNVGFGFTYVLPIIVAVLAARPGDLLLIENPESHLHPQGQAQLGSLLACAAADGVQLIVETHSDHLINGVRVAVKEKQIKPEQVSVYFFERDPDSEEHVTEIVQPTIDANGRLSQQPRGFFDEYTRQLDRLLQ